MWRIIPTCSQSAAHGTCEARGGAWGCVGARGSAWERVGLPCEVVGGRHRVGVSMWVRASGALTADAQANRRDPRLFGTVGELRAALEYGVHLFIAGRNTHGQRMAGELEFWGP